jgi:DNA-binding protein HU-beta
MISPPAHRKSLGGKMSIDKKELVKRVQKRLSKGSGTVEEIIDATVEEIYESLKLGERWVFKFNPSQRLRQLFGWSSTYKS